MADCDKSLREHDLLVLITAFHIFKTILAPIGMFSLLRFAYQLFRRSKVTEDKGEQRSSSNFFFRLKPSGNRLIAHSNMEILYVNHLIAAVLLSFFSFLTHLTFWGSLIISPDCDIKYPAVFCIALNTPVHICTHAVALSLFFLCIERASSTLFYRSYASIGSLVSKVMVVVQYLICSLLFYYQIFTIDTQSLMSICSLIGSSNQQRTTHVQARRYRKSIQLLLTIQITIFTLELTSLIVFTFLKRYNKRQLNQSIGLSLKERYQLDENVRSLRTIFPTIVIHTICFFIPNAISLLIFIIIVPRKGEVVIIDLALNWLPYYALLLPIIINCISKRVNRLQEKRMVKNTATGSAMQNTYFEELREAWK